MPNLTATPGKTSSYLEQPGRLRSQRGAQREILPGTAVGPPGSNSQKANSAQHGVLPKHFLETSGSDDKIAKPTLPGIAGGSPASSSAKAGGPPEIPSQKVWFKEYWDRYIRDENHMRLCIDYIQQNPVKADLAADAKNWPYSSAHRASPIFCPSRKSSSQTK